MQRVKLTKINSTHSHLRSSDVEGWCFDIPQVGLSFAMTSAPLEEGFMRIIKTTPLQTIERVDSTFLFTTANSTYRLELLDETT